MCKEEYAQAIDKAVFPGLQGGPLMHVIAAKAVCFGEALRPEFKDYQAQIVKNASAMCDALIDGGLRIVSGGTDNHLMLVDVFTPLGMTGKDAEALLDKAHITVNKNAIPFDTQKRFVTSGLRIGTPAMTTRGFKEAEAAKIGGLIARVIRDGESAVESVAAEVSGLCRDFPLYSK